MISIVSIAIATEFTVLSHGINFHMWLTILCSRERCSIISVNWCFPVGLTQRDIGLTNSLSSAEHRHVAESKPLARTGLSKWLPCADICLSLGGFHLCRTTKKEKVRSIAAIMLTELRHVILVVQHWRSSVYTVPFVQMDSKRVHKTMCVYKTSPSTGLQVP